MAAPACPVLERDSANFHTFVLDCMSVLRRAFDHMRVGSDKLAWTKPSLGSDWPPFVLGPSAVGFANEVVNDSGKLLVEQAREAPLVCAGPRSWVSSVCDLNTGSSGGPFLRKRFKRPQFFDGDAGDAGGNRMAGGAAVRPPASAGIGAGFSQRAQGAERGGRTTDGPTDASGNWTASEKRPAGQDSTKFPTLVINMLAGVWARKLHTTTTNRDVVVLASVSFGHCCRKACVSSRCFISLG